MELKKEKLEELEEQLVLLYKFVAQNNSFKKFYYEGVDVKTSFNDETGILTTLLENDDSEEILKTCVMELEQSKNEGNNEELKKFHEVLDSYDTEILYKKYGMNGVEDVDKLDIKKIISNL
jgi:hypothetical protein